LELETERIRRHDRPMNLVATEPIRQHWTLAGPSGGPSGREGRATVADVTRRLALLDVPAVDATLAPLLAAAAGEVAVATGIAWCHRNDDPPVALLRLIAKVAIRNPTAGGPHTDRLSDELT
jgi:hypothetical protein